MHYSFLLKLYIIFIMEIIEVVIDQAVYCMVEMIPLDDFQFTMVISTGQYVSFDMISIIVCFIISV